MIIQLLGAKPSNLQPKIITHNGRYVAADEDVDGFDVVTVAVPNTTEEKTITANGEYSPTLPVIGYRKVTVSVQNQTEEKSITANGVYTPTSPNIGFSKVTVNVPQTPSYMTTLSAAANKDSDTQYDASTYGYDGFKSVIVEKVTSSIDSNIQAENIKSGVTILGVDGTYSGITPTGTKNINTNGTYDISTYQYASVNVPAPMYFIPRTVDNGKLVATIQDTINLTGVTEIGDWMMAGACYGNFFLTGALDLSEIIVLGSNSCSSAFGGTSITSIDLSSLSVISYASCSDMCTACSYLTTADISRLLGISGYSSYAFRRAFMSCTQLSSVDFSGLMFVRGSNVFEQAFSGCTSLTSVTFDMLNEISSSHIFVNAFQSCTGLTSLSFPALTSGAFGDYTSQFYRMLFGVTGCTVHFPSNLSSVIGSWSDVINGFGGTDTTVLFDLPETE